MVYSFTQISQYLRCPRSYRYRYLDGWREKETRAAWFLAAVLRTLWVLSSAQEDPGAALFTEWDAYRDVALEYQERGYLGSPRAPRNPFAGAASHRTIGFRIHDPQGYMQIKIIHTLPGGSEFLAYVDAIGELDGRRCMIDWKTTTSSLSR